METLSSLIASRRSLRPGGFPESNPPAIKRNGFDLRGRYWAVEAHIRARTDTSRKTYRTLIVFMGRQFKKEDPQDPKYIRIEVFKRKYRWMNLPSMSKTPVMISCNCADYYFTWWWYNDENMAMAGDEPDSVQKVLKRTVRVHDGKPYGTRPGSRNDEQAPGLCKHVMALAQELVKQKKILR